MDTESTDGRSAPGREAHRELGVALLGLGAGLALNSVLGPLAAGGERCFSPWRCGCTGGCSLPTGDPRSPDVQKGAPTVVDAP